MNNYYQKIAAILFIIILSINLNATSFSQSKKILLNKIYFDNQYTFYCGNPYKIDEINGKDKALIIKNKKYYSSRNDSFFSFFDNNERAKIVEWEHIMPVPFIFSKYGQEKSLKLYVVKS